MSGMSSIRLFLAGGVTFFILSATPPVQAASATLFTITTADGAFTYDPATVVTGSDDRITLVVTSADPHAVVFSEISYELDCATHSFRQLAVRETRNGSTSSCTNPSEPIALKQKHAVPAMLFKRLCTSSVLP